MVTSLKPIKVIFLDFDGVLNSAQETHYNRFLDKTLWSRRFKDWLGHLLYHPFGLFHHPNKPVNSVNYKPYKWFFEKQRRDFSVHHLSSHWNFCPIACSNLRELLASDRSIMIVVSSVWRLSGLEEVKAVLKRNDIDPDRVIDITGRGLGFNKKGTAGTGLRGHQIQEWLSKRANCPTCIYGPVSHFAILDDDKDMGHLWGSLVHVDGYHGFMYRDMIKVAKKLKIKSYLTKRYRKSK